MFISSIANCIAWVSLTIKKRQCGILQILVRYCDFDSATVIACMYHPARLIAEYKRRIWIFED